MHYSLRHDDGDTSEAFPVTNCVKQGCVLAPTLFSMVFAAMLTDAFQNHEDGIPLRYRTDGRIFNPRRLQAITKVKETVIRDFLFADDCALNASTEEEMQHELDCFSSACDNFGLTISTTKTEVMYQTAPGKPYHEPCITVKGHKLQAVDSFTYLGSTLSREFNIDVEVNNRIAKASAAFGRLRKNVWERRGLSTSTKLKVYRAVVLTTLLHACETWTVYNRHAKQLNHFHTTCLRRLLRIKWQDKIPDSEVLRRACIPSIYTLLQKAQLRWAGHLVRMSDSRLPKQLFYGELSSGKRSLGGQKKRFKDSLKMSVKDFGICDNTWETLAKNRSVWRSGIASGAHSAEARRLDEAEKKRAARKARAGSISTLGSEHTCPTCGKNCRARIGLLSHLRTHRPLSTSN